MFHAHTNQLIDTWRAHRAGRRLPARADLTPIDLGALLPQVFMLGREPDGEEVFRLCGGLMADLHGRDLRGSSFYGLWSKLDRPQVAAALARARSAAQPVVITAHGFSDRGDQVAVELALAPLTGPSGEPDRAIGLYQPVSPVARLMGGEVKRFEIRAVTPAPEPEVFARPRLRLVVDNTRKVA